MKHIILNESFNALLGLQEPREVVGFHSDTVIMCWGLKLLLHFKVAL